MHTDQDNLRLLYAMNTGPYQPRGYWTTSRSFKINELKPVAEFVLDNKMITTKHEFKLDGEFKQVGKK